MRAGLGLHWLSRGRLLESAAMSWDLSILKTPPIERVEDLPDDFEPEVLGPREDIIEKIEKALPGVDFEDPSWGEWANEESSIEFNIGDEEECDGVMLHVRGDGDPMDLVKAVVDAIGVTAIDHQSGELFTLEEARASFEEWKEFRDSVAKQQGGPLDGTEEDEFHVPQGALMEKEGVSLIMYTIFLEVSSPQRLSEHIMTVLDAHAGNWSETEFEGHLWLNCWNDAVADESREMVEGALRECGERAQKLTDEHGIKTATGKSLVFHCSFRNELGADLDPWELFSLINA